MDAVACGDHATSPGGTGCTSSSCCSCDDGYFMEEADTGLAYLDPFASSSARRCSPCPKDSYCLDGARFSCPPSRPFTPPGEVGAMSPDECTCPPGYYTSFFTGTCLPCPQGFYCEYDPVLGATQRHACPEGQVTPSLAVDESGCRCPDGFTKSVADNSVCIVCPVGHVCRADAEEDGPEPCPDGMTTIPPPADRMLAAIHPVTGRLDLSRAPPGVAAHSPPLLSRFRAPPFPVLRTPCIVTAKTTGEQCGRLRVRCGQEAGCPRGVCLGSHAAYLHGMCARFFLPRRQAGDAVPVPTDDGGRGAPSDERG